MSGRIKALTLYKSILRAHSKYLPMEMRHLGDAYVKSEFRLHKSVAKSNQLDQFFNEWEKYLSHIEQTGRKKQSTDAGLVDSGQANTGGFGRDVSRDVVLNEEQESQLEKLREEARTGATRGDIP